MARRKAAPRRRRPKVISLLNIGEGIAQANIVTQAFLGTSAIGFVLDNPMQPGVSIRDAIQNPQKLYLRLLTGTLSKFKLSRFQNEAV